MLSLTAIEDDGIMHTAWPYHALVVCINRFSFGILDPLLATSSWKYSCRRRLSSTTNSLQSVVIAKVRKIQHHTCMYRNYERTMTYNSWNYSHLAAMNRNTFWKHISKMFYWNGLHCQIALDLLQSIFLLNIHFDVCHIIYFISWWFFPTNDKYYIVIFSIYAIPLCSLFW